MKFKTEGGFIFNYNFKEGVIVIVFILYFNKEKERKIIIYIVCNKYWERVSQID
jgi:hypothetical protein